MNRKLKFIIIGLICLLIVGCSTWEDEGALYFAEKGKIVCVEVDTVMFHYDGRGTVYRLGAKRYSTRAALDYYPKQKCS